MTAPGQIEASRVPRRNGRVSESVSRPSLEHPRGNGLAPIAEFQPALSDGILLV
jgi:hypothetical protein